MNQQNIRHSITFDFITDLQIWHKTHNKQRKIRKLDFITIKNALQRTVYGNKIKDIIQWQKLTNPMPTL